MKLYTCIAAALLIFGTLAVTAHAANQYWDINGTNTGATDTSDATGAWDGVATNWNATSTGITTATTAWTSGNVAIFSAGTNATDTFTITLTGTQTVSGMTFEEGNVTLTGGSLALTGTTDTITATAPATIATDISGTSALTKSGVDTLTISGAGSWGGTTTVSAGTLTLTGANALTGATTVNAGTLNLDYTTNNNNKINAAGLLTLGNGATVNLIGNAGAPTSQTVNGLTLSASGASSIAIAPSAQTVTLNLGAITRGSASVINFTTTDSANTVITTSSTGTNGIVGGYATFGDSDWAAVSGGSITALGTYNSDFNTIAATENMDATADAAPAADSSMNSLRFNTGANVTVTLAGTTNTITTGGILVTSNVGGSAAAISGADLTSGSSDLVVVQNNTGADFTINSAITGTGIGLTKAGAGTLVISGNNTATGSHTVLAGTLKLGAADRIADTAVVNVLTGATFDMNGNSETVGSIAGAGAYVLGGTLTTGGLNSSTTVSGPMSGGGDLTKNGTGTLTLSAANTYGGSTDIQGGVVAVSTTTGLGTTGAGTTVQTGAALQVSGSLSGANSIAEQITINGTGIANAGALRHTASATTLSGGIILGSSGARINSDSSTLTIGTNQVFGPGDDLTVGGAANTTISAVLNIGAGTLTKDGAGVLTLSGNNITAFSGKIRVNGGVLAWSSDNSFTNNLGVGPASFVPDYVIVDGATLRMTTSDTTGTSFMRSGRGIQLTANGGTIDMSSTAAGAKAIYTSGDTSTVVGNAGIIGLTTGTTAATLTKIGAGEFRVQGSGTPSYAFTKLVLKGGLYRIGSQLTNSVQQSKETGFGAVPSIFTQDAILLDGGSIASTVSFTLNANRGVTMTSNGGGLQGGITIATPLVSQTPGSGTLRQEAGTNVLSSATNVTSFDANLASNAGTLTLSASLNVRDFSGTASGTSAADTNINGSSVKLTVGNGTPTNTTYSGRLLGSGKFRKIGSNTITFDMAGAGNLLDLTGTGADVFVIDGGGITFANTIATSVAGFNAAVAGTLSLQINNGTLDMTVLPLAGGVYTHNFGSLNSAATTGSVLIGTNNITLGQTATTARSYNGTITSTGGTLTKGGGTFTQTLAGNNTLGAVNVNLGRLNFNGTNTTGAVTVASTAALGGTGSVSGAVNVQSGGTLAPGTSVGTLGTGAVTLTSGSTFQYELNSSGTPAFDLLNANGALSLGGATLTGIDLAGTSTLLSAGTKVTLISYSGAWDSSTFAGIANNDPVTIGVNTFNIKYDDTAAGTNGGLYSGYVTLAIPAAGCAPGDLNCDTHVDAGDYVFWRKNNSTPAGDYNIWRANFGVPAGAGSGGGLGGTAAVPEPSTLALVGLAWIGLLAKRRRAA